MSKEEAVQMAREALKKLGIPLELVFAEQEPKVTLSAPYYRIVWSDIWPGGCSVDMEIDAGAKRVEQLHILNLNLHRPSPKVAVVPPAKYPPTWRINPEYAQRLAPILLRAVDDYGERLSLPLPRPLNTNHAERLILLNTGGRPSGWLKLSNGWWFVYRNSTVSGFYASGSTLGLTAFHKRILVKEALGHWNLTQTQAMEVVARTLARLNYPSNVVRIDLPPQLVTKPAIPGIARYMFLWQYTPPSRHSETEGDVDYALQSEVTAEVDADKGEVKALYYEVADWGQPPPIDVPISLPMPSPTNQSPAKSSGARPAPRPPALSQRLDHPVPLPR